jgi:hypothetical protein
MDGGGSCTGAMSAGGGGGCGNASDTALLPWTNCWYAWYIIPVKGLLIHSPNPGAWCWGGAAAEGM